MLEYYTHIVQEDSLVLNHWKTIVRVFIKCKAKNVIDTIGLTKSTTS